MTPKKIFAKLRKLAPSVCFSVSRELDPTPWDGDGPQPKGMTNYVITVYAKAIVGGEMVEGWECLGSHWMTLKERIGDVGGYLPQMLRAAADHLRLQTKDEAIVAQVEAVQKFLKLEMRERYYKQMTKG